MMDSPLQLSPLTLDDKTTPAQVRQYFARVRTHHHQIPSSEAEEIFQEWHYGNGTTAQGFDADAYRTMFGPEIGTLL
jgi:hypothetical protein